MDVSNVGHGGRSGGKRRRLDEPRVETDDHDGPSSLLLPMPSYLNLQPSPMLLDDVAPSFLTPGQNTFSSELFFASSSTGSLADSFSWHGALPAGCLSNFQDWSSSSLQGPATPQYQYLEAGFNNPFPPTPFATQFLLQSQFQPPRLDKPFANPLLGLIASTNGSETFAAPAALDTSNNGGALEFEALNVSTNQTVCFGMIANINCKCDYDGSKLPSPFLVYLSSSDKFNALADNKISGNIISSEHGPIVHGLLDETTLKLVGECTISAQPSKGKTSRPGGKIACTLTITVYGPMDMFDEIGEWLQEYDVYLQDPVSCHLDVNYCNPHKLGGNWAPLSQVVSARSSPVQLLDIAQLPSLLDDLNTHDDLEESDTPRRLHTKLQRHQGQALTFMRRREQGWAFHGPSPDIWEVVENGQLEFFVNRVSRYHQPEEPPRFSGGIVADPMGLGKTLTMIALVASDYDSVPASSQIFGADNNETMGSTAPQVSATLIVVPPSLIDTWDEEISKHVLPEGLSCSRHHGRARFTQLSELQGVDIVLATYDTVSAEWKQGRDTSRSILFSVCWKRVILDEAHFIRNGASRRARAVCSIDALSRWAVTGTPIQNRLGDLATLLRFIRAYPYTEPSRFDADISQLWKSGRDEEAVKRLKTLSACLLLRRPPATINLPARRDTVCPVNFTPSERAVYVKAREQAIVKIDEALKQGQEFSRRTVYVNVLQQIEALRQICNLGECYSTRLDDLSLLNLSKDWERAAQRIFNNHRDQSQMTCFQCCETLDSADSVLVDPSDDGRALFFSCLRYLCADCTGKLKPKSKMMSCGHHPCCPEAAITVSSLTLDEAPGMAPGEVVAAPEHLPSKVECLIADLRSLPPQTKCVVFSTWRTTLDVVERGLKQANISFVRFDGKVAQKDRWPVVQQFKEDQSIRLMLLTLSCGAVGLTLTVASRAYLMEPNWNPTIEDQALARIHRIGQTQEVTTVRFYIQNSFEEEVMKLQKKKKQLADVLLSSHDGSQSDDTLDRLHELRRLL